MKKNQILLFVVICLFVSFSLFPVVSGNDSCKAMEPGCDNPPGGGGGIVGNISVMSALPLKFYIVNGSANFTDSESYFKRYLTKVENSELYPISPDEISSDLTLAYQYMTIANGEYLELNDICCNIPYNQNVIQKLRTFDYAKFQQIKGLNPSIFANVENFLKNGDVKGVYEKFYEDTAAILELLEYLKENIESPFPLDTIWSTNQKYAESLLFGQYIAMIFLNLEQ